MNDIDLLLSVAQKHTQLKQLGDKYTGLCPIHNEKTPSFWVYPNGKYRCYGCNSSGDAIDLHRAITGDDYITAKKALGLWDDSRPQPRKPRAKPWPKEYASDDKRKAYRAARASVIAAKDMDIIYRGKTYLNHEFIARCLAPLPGYYDHVMKICVQISANAKTDMDRYVLPDLFFENVIDVIERYQEIET